MIGHRTFFLFIHLRYLETALINLPSTLLGLNDSNPGGLMQRDCSWRHNVTDINKISADQLDILENCLFYYLLYREASKSHGFIGSGIHNALSLPPPEVPLVINIKQFIVRRVDLVQKSTMDFRIHGDLFMSWNDSRLMWNETEWRIENFELHDSHHIWTPTFTDLSECSSAEGCRSNIEDIQINSDGTTIVRMDFHYFASCHINFYRYPEETNDCCLYLSLLNQDTMVKYNILTKERLNVYKPVALNDRKKNNNSPILPEFDSFKLSNIETSTWIVKDRTVRVVPIRSFLHGEYLELCVHAMKDMATLKMALRMPVTIATMLMLVSPLFGDLRTQAFVKLFTLMLQTVCFIFLCSIAPPNGFNGFKPKIYTFYEFLFFITFLSIFVTLVCLALSRLKRNVPAAHNFYLLAKVINHFMCCIEPDASINYQRHFEDFDTISNCGGTNNQAGAARTGNDVSHHSMSNDYTMEWRQIYIAANNLFSGVCFSIFCFVIIFEIM